MVPLRKCEHVHRAWNKHLVTMCLKVGKPWESALLNENVSRDGDRSITPLPPVASKVPFSLGSGFCEENNQRQTSKKWGWGLFIVCM